MELSHRRRRSVFSVFSRSNGRATHECDRQEYVREVLPGIRGRCLGDDRLTLDGVVRHADVPGWRGAGVGLALHTAVRRLRRLSGGVVVAADRPQGPAAAPRWLWRGSSAGAARRRCGPGPRSCAESGYVPEPPRGPPPRRRRVPRLRGGPAAPPRRLHGPRGGGARARGKRWV